MHTEDKVKRLINYYNNCFVNGDIDYLNDKTYSYYDHIEEFITYYPSKNELIFNEEYFNDEMVFNLSLDVDKYLTYLKNFLIKRFRFNEGNLKLRFLHYKSTKPIFI